MSSADAPSSGKLLPRMMHMLASPAMSQLGCPHWAWSRTRACTRPAQGSKHAQRDAAGANKSDASSGPPAQHKASAVGVNPTVLRNSPPQLCESLAALFCKQGPKDMASHSRKRSNSIGRCRPCQRDSRPWTSSPRMLKYAGAGAWPCTACPRSCSRAARLLR